MKNPLTTIFGALTALGTAFANIPGKLGTIAQIVQLGAMALWGYHSKDKNQPK